MGERQVQIGAGAPGNALLVGVAKEVGKLDLRVGMNRAERDIATVVENVLRPVAVVVVDVEKGDAAMRGEFFGS